MPIEMLAEDDGHKRKPGDPLLGIWPGKEDSDGFSTLDIKITPGFASVLVSSGMLDDMIDDLKTAIKVSAAKHDETCDCTKEGNPLTHEPRTSTTIH